MCPKIATLTQSRVLPDLYERLKGDPFSGPTIEFADGFNRYSENQDHLHEAGYDSYLAGFCFLKMAHYIGTTQENPDECPVLTDSKALEPYLNKIAIIRTDANLNLGGKDEIPSRANIFYVDELESKDIKSYHLQKHFSAFGDGSVSIRWINSRSCFICIGKINKSLSQQDIIQKSPQYKIKTYEDYKSENKTRL